MTHANATLTTHTLAAHGALATHGARSRARHTRARAHDALRACDADPLPTPVPSVPPRNARAAVTPPSPQSLFHSTKLRQACSLPLHSTKLARLSHFAKHAACLTPPSSPACSTSPSPPLVSQHHTSARNTQRARDAAHRARVTHGALALRGARAAHRAARLQHTVRSQHDARSQHTARSHTRRTRDTRHRARQACSKLVPLHQATPACSHQATPACSPGCDFPCRRRCRASTHATPARSRWLAARLAQQRWLEQQLSPASGQTKPTPGCDMPCRRRGHTTPARSR